MIEDSAVTARLTRVFADNAIAEVIGNLVA